MLPAMKRINALLTAMGLVFLLAGCTYGGHPLRIEPVASKGGEIRPNFRQIYYRVDRDKNVYFYLKATPTKGQKEIDQTVVIRVFWKPIGGRTSLNAAAINSTFRYVVSNPTGAGSYEGAGFVRFYSRIGSKELRAKLMDGDLRLTEATSGFVDTLKRSRIRGTFIARRDDGQTVDLMLQAQRDFFARTFAAANKPAVGATTQATSAPGTAPATGPATGP